MNFKQAVSARLFVPNKNPTNTPPIQVGCTNIPSVLALVYHML